MIWRDDHESPWEDEPSPLHSATRGSPIDALAVARRLDVSSDGVFAVFATQRADLDILTLLAHCSESERAEVLMAMATRRPVVHLASLIAALRRSGGRHKQDAETLVDLCFDHDGRLEDCLLQHGLRNEAKRVRRRRGGVAGWKPGFW